MKTSTVALVLTALFSTAAWAADCSHIVPACDGGHIVGQTNCRCQGQVEVCDLWTCPRFGGGSDPMVCGQRGSGCVYI